MVVSIRGLGCGDCRKGMGAYASETVTPDENSGAFYGPIADGRYVNLADFLQWQQDQMRANTVTAAAQFTQVAQRTGVTVANPYTAALAVMPAPQETVPTTLFKPIGPAVPIAPVLSGSNASLRIGVPLVTPPSLTPPMPSQSDQTAQQAGAGMPQATATVNWFTSSLFNLGTFAVPNWMLLAGLGAAGFAIAKGVR